MMMAPKLRVLLCLLLRLLFVEGFIGTRIGLFSRLVVREGHPIVNLPLSNGGIHVVGCSCALCSRKTGGLKMFTSHAMGCSCVACSRPVAASRAHGPACSCISCTGSVSKITHSKSCVCPTCSRVSTALNMLRSPGDVAPRQRIRCQCAQCTGTHDKNCTCISCRKHMVSMTMSPTSSASFREHRVGCSCAECSGRTSVQRPHALNCHCSQCARGRSQSSSTALMMATTDDIILRRIDKWACVKNCGACCKLGPLDSRPDLEEYLSAEEFAHYKSLIGADNWCTHFDKENRVCTIYDTRPEFCKVDPKKYKKMFGVDEEDLNEFCKFCCTEQIADVYGEESEEMDRFETVIEGLESEVEM